MIREDKNGTKYYHIACTCGKCGGSGYIGYYARIYGGVCFDCDGSGVVEYDEKEYTPEYEAKLMERRAKAQEKKLEKAREASAEKNLQFFEKQGFNLEGKCWVVLGNTYDIKDELKSKGARWMSIARKWYFNHSVEEYPTIELTADDFYFQDVTGTYDWRNWRDLQDEKLNSAINRIAEADKAAKGVEPSHSQFVGEIGEKITRQMTLVNSHSWENSYGHNYWDNKVTTVYIFKDEDGNVFTWKTGTYIEADYGTVLTVSGTIKDHTEYKDTKQTVLTRCKVSI